jgi:hypothetical protein
VAEALCSVFKQPAMIPASAPMDRIDIAFIGCFLVHKGSGCLSSQAQSEANRNQDPASLSGKFSANKLIGVNHDYKITGEHGCK